MNAVFGWLRLRGGVQHHRLRHERFDRECFVYESAPDALATLGDRREIGVRLEYAF